MVNYRDRVDIIADILNVVSREAKKTQIMYQANLSYRVLQKYLYEIVESALIKYEHHSQSYSLTFKGHKYLEAYKDYARCSRSMEKRLNDFSIKKKLLESLCPMRQTKTYIKQSVK